MAALYPTPTLRALAHLDLEVPHDRFDLRQVLLVLRRHAGHLDLAAAVRTRRRNRRRMRLVNPCRPPPAAMRAVIGAGPPSRTPAASLRPVLGEGGRLPLAGSPGRVELLLQVFTVTLPVIPLLDQLRVLLFELLDARVPRIPFTLRPVRTAALAVHQNHVLLSGTRTPILHPNPADFSPRPLNEDRLSSLLSQTLVRLSTDEALLARYVELRQGGAPSREVARLMKCIQRNPHPTVWEEMKRQHTRHVSLSTLFSAAPEALGF